MAKRVLETNSIEFLQLQPTDISPLISKCTIKVLYTNENRNKSLITKDVAAEMAKTLRGVPIVGAYSDEAHDFTDHGERVVIEDDEIKFTCVTTPYGFVAPDAKVWFQNFKELDDKGEEVDHLYLMTEGYLWTGQFAECQSVIDEGKGQSMELDEKSLQGQWAKTLNRNMDFFIISDATFTKLCILGDAVEPCFEGASIEAAPTEYTKMDDNFKSTLFSMMQDLKKIVSERGSEMEVTENTVVENSEISAGETGESIQAENEEVVTETFKKTDNDEDAEAQPEEPKAEPEDKQDESEEDKDEKPQTKSACTPDDEHKKKYELLESEYAELQAKYQELEQECVALRTFKLSVEDAKKDELINSFYMLSDEDKKDCIENKSKYSYNDIEAKLSIICVHKKVNFNLENEIQQNEESAPITYNLQQNTEDSVPAWISALKNTRDSRNI